MGLDIERSGRRRAGNGGGKEDTRAPIPVIAVEVLWPGESLHGLIERAADRGARGVQLQREIKKRVERPRLCAAAETAHLALQRACGIRAGERSSRVAGTRWEAERTRGGGWEGGGRDEMLGRGMRAAVAVAGCAQQKMEVPSHLGTSSARR